MTLPNPAPNPAACPDKTLQNAVAQAFPTLNQPWTPLQGGRVNAVWRAGDMVIKHYHPSGDSPLFPNDPAAEAAALSLLAPFGLAPKLLGKGQGWIAYHYCPGTAWKTNTARVADTLTRLHQTPFQTAGFRHAPNGSAALLAQAKSIAALCKQASGKPALPPPPPDPSTTVLIDHGKAMAEQATHDAVVAAAAVVDAAGVKVCRLTCCGYE